MIKTKEIKDISIFLYGENANGYIIDKSQIEDFSKFENVPIVNKIKERKDEEFEQKIIGVVKNATRIEYPYVYGDIVVFDEFKLTKFRNYEVNCDVERDEIGIKYLVNVEILSIELE